MKPGEEIANETDPFLREIWAAGWDDVYRDPCSGDVLLIHQETRTTKRVNIYRLMISHSWCIKSAILMDGRTHSWISDANGDAKKFRELIGKPPQNE